MTANIFCGRIKKIQSSKLKKGCPFHSRYQLNFIPDKLITGIQIFCSKICSRYEVKLYRY